VRSVIALLLALGWAAPAQAFHGQADFDKPAMEGGGGGTWFTGSPRFRRWDCTLCHQNAPGRIRMTLATEPAGLVRDGVYAPGAIYRVTVSLQGEHRGLGAALNPNTFVLEAVDDQRRPAGLFAGLGAAVERPPGQELVVARGEVEGQTAWSFEWIAPEPGSGPVTIHLAGVDGDGAGDRLGRTGDPFGDDVFVGSLRIQEEGNVQPEDQSTRATGCSASGAMGTGAPIWLVMLLLLAWGCHDPKRADECERGICETPTDGGGGPAGDGGGGPGTDGGGGPDTDGALPPGDGGAGCMPDWRCTTWETACDGSGAATRTCTAASGCGTGAGKPSESRTLEPLDESFYRCRVQPIFDRSCAQLACHGAEDRPLRTYSRLKWRIDPLRRGTHMNDGNAALTADEWCRNYDSARAFATSDAAGSELLTQPLRPAVGGLTHAGYTLFWDTSDDDYQTLREWLEGASLGSCDAGFND